MVLEIMKAESAEQLEQIRGLWHEYMNWDVEVTGSLGLDVNQLITFVYENGQFDLPGKYAPPEGCLLLATWDGETAGCGAWHRMDETTCEIKRMYVRPAFRGKRIGKGILERLVEDARQKGFSRLLLETVTFMQEAQSMYASLGFRKIEPYYEIPDDLKPITLFMEMKLNG